MTQHASWASGSMSEPGPTILPTLFFSARKARGTGILAASARPAPMSLIMSGYGIPEDQLRSVFGLSPAFSAARPNRYWSILPGA